MKIQAIAVSMLLASAVAPHLPRQGLILGAGFFLLLAWRLKSRAGFFLLSMALSLVWVSGVQYIRSDDLRRQLSVKPQSARVRIQVRGDMEQRSYPGRSPTFSVPVQALEFYQAGAWHPCRGRFQLNLPADDAPELLTGSVWETAGVLRPGNFSYTGLFRADWRLLPDPGSLEKKSRAPPQMFLQSFFVVRARVSEKVSRLYAEQRDVSGTLQALLLGKRSEVDRDLSQRFARTGLVHVFAVSGLHLGLLAGMLTAICKWFRISPRWRPWILLPVLLLFTLYTGLRASALRALIMIACVVFSTPLYRRAHIPSAFCLALILILAIAPGQVYDLGFQYSFLLVGGLLAFGQFFSEKIHNGFSGDPWKVVSDAEAYRHRVIWSRVQGGLMVTLLCFVLAAPLTAYTFNLFSPVGLLGNLLAVPLVFLLLATGFPVLPLLFLPDQIAHAALLPAAFCAESLLGWVKTMEKIPGGVQWVQAPPLWMLFGFYGLIFACWFRPACCKVWLALLLGLGAFAGTSAVLEARRTEVVVMDADRGQALWLKLPGEDAVLVDAGSLWSGKDVAERLQRQGIDRIDTVIFTHPDRFHLEGWQQISETYTPKRILAANCDLSHTGYEKLLPELGGLSRGETLTVGGWQMEVLHPEFSSMERAADNRSLVLRFTHGRASVLVMGGSGEKVSKELLALQMPLQATVLVAGHPRNQELFHPDFLKAVQPEVVVFSGQGYEGISAFRTEAENTVFSAGVRVLRVGEGQDLQLFPLQGSFVQLGDS